MYLEIAIRKFASKSFVNYSEERENTCICVYAGDYTCVRLGMEPINRASNSRSLYARSHVWKCRCVAKAIYVDKFRVIQIYPPLFPNE